MRPRAPRAGQGGVRKIAGDGFVIAQIGTMTLDQALSEREHQHRRPAADGGRHRQVGHPDRPHRDHRDRPAAEDPRGAGPAEAGGPGEAGDDPAVRGPPAVGDQRGRGCCAGCGAPGRRATAGRDLRAEGNRQATILESEGRAQAIETVYAAIKKGDPDPTLVAILQLDTLAKFADSPNARLWSRSVSRSARGRADAPQCARGRPDRRRPPVSQTLVTSAGASLRRAQTAEPGNNAQARGRPLR